MPVKPNAILTCDLPASSAEDWIDRSIQYMVQHLDAPLPVPRLAALSGVSPSHFFALFKRRTGSTPIDFFIRLRMQRACHLLNTTGFNVKEIADVLGYDDPFYFSRVFKSVNGMAPSDYRAARDQESKSRNGKFESANKKVLPRKNGATRLLETEICPSAK